MAHDERTDLLAELATARAALTKTTDGPSDEQAAERPTVSALCLGGLVMEKNHPAEVAGR